MSRTLEHLERLVGFASLTDTPNGEIVDYIAGVLGAAGARVHRIDGGEGKSGLFAAIGPEGPGGVMLSGHVDVVPVAGQDWSSDPFTLRRADDRVYGRGTTDMKGFLAAMLSAAERAGALARPLKLAFSWDEEIGCRGIPVMLERIDATVGRPEACIVGEPTGMQIALGHKGKTSLRAVARGQAGHSAEAPDYVNALHLAAGMIGALRDEQDRLARTGAQDDGFAIPYSTVHAGVMQGGRALNIVPDWAEIAFEIRNLAEEPPGEIIARLHAAAREIVARGGAGRRAGDRGDRGLSRACHRTGQPGGDAGPGRCPGRGPDQGVLWHRGGAFRGARHRNGGLRAGRHGAGAQARRVHRA